MKSGKILEGLIKWFYCSIFCFALLSCAGTEVNSEAYDYAVPKQYSPVVPYYPQEYAPRNYHYSRYYSNPYSYSPQNYYPYYDSDQYYVAPLPYSGYEQDNYYRNNRAIATGNTVRNPHNSSSSGDGGKY
ncbi:MAG: hypothetical protein EBS06_01400 [Proteobacteria bacterium]|nr:hypothetical protein [Pseudomonadota bacterium]